LDTQQQHPHLDDLRGAFVASEDPNIVYCMGGSGDVGLLLENRPRSTTVPYQSVNSVSSGLQYPGGAPEPIYENVPLPWAADGRVAGNNLVNHVLITGCGWRIILKWILWFQLAQDRLQWWGYLFIYLFTSWICVKFSWKILHHEVGVRMIGDIIKRECYSILHVSVLWGSS
jgi:hypothetical protein